MSAKLIAVEGDTVRIELNIKLSRSMLESEETILSTLNEAGCIATGEALKRFDTDGSAILIGGTKWTSRGEEPNYYQTPYGEVEVLRHVYQTSAGGKTFCPLEREARIVVTSTPRFARGWRINLRVAVRPRWKVTWLRITDGRWHVPIYRIWRKR